MSFMEIFQPELKFLREERERQRMNVAYPTDGADPLMEVDLDAGTATIVVPAPTTDQATEQTTDPAQTADHEASGDLEGTDPPRQ